MIDIASRNHFDVPLPYAIGNLQPGANRFYKTDQFTFSISNPFVYEEFYRYTISSKKLEVVEKFKLTGGKKFDLTQFDLKTVNAGSYTHLTLPTIHPV